MKLIIYYSIWFPSYVLFVKHRLDTVKHNSSVQFRDARTDILVRNMWSQFKHNAQFKGMGRILSQRMTLVECYAILLLETQGSWRFMFKAFPCHDGMLNLEDRWTFLWWLHNERNLFGVIIRLFGTEPFHWIDDNLSSQTHMQRRNQFAPVKVAFYERWDASFHRTFVSKNGQINKNR